MIDIRRRRRAGVPAGKGRWCERGWRAAWARRSVGRRRHAGKYLRRHRMNFFFHLLRRVVESSKRKSRSDEKNDQHCNDHLEQCVRFLGAGSRSIAWYIGNRNGRIGRRCSRRWHRSTWLRRWHRSTWLRRWLGGWLGRAANRAEVASSHTRGSTFRAKTHSSLP